ncbi:flavin reductase family protein [Streptomyces mirabilis]|uniref:flavin reductase family protein n=1 Tax=Streptomyces mirabilis TaxID=68239 RepID=UPI00332E4768
MFPSGVTAVCAQVNGAPIGLAASSFTSVSIDPPLVSLCIAHSSTTWPALRAARRLGISVLAEEHADIATSLSSKSRDRFDRVEWMADDNHCVFVRGSTLWLDCSIASEVPAGDHNIVVLLVHSVVPYPDVSPLVFHGSQFRQLSA